MCTDFFGINFANPCFRIFLPGTSKLVGPVILGSSIPGSVNGFLKARSGTPPNRALWGTIQVLEMGRDPAL